MLGVLLCIFLMAGYYKIIFHCLKFCGVNFAKILKEEFLKIFFVSAVSIIFLIFIVNSQQTIYMFDSLETWEPMIYCEEITFSDSLQALKNLRGSINHADYNNFIPMLITLPAHVFGKSFLCYTLYIWIMFGLPAVFLLSAWLKNFLESRGFKVFSCAEFMAVQMLCTVFITPVIIGYANISILLTGSIIFMMLMNLKKSELQTERLFFIGVLSVFSVFQARTAAYMIVGCFCGYTVYIIFTSYLEKNLREIFLMLMKKFFVIGFSAVIISAPLFYPFIEKSVTYDIGSAYSAYAMGQDFLNRIFIHFLGFGVVACAIFFSAVFCGLKNKNLLPSILWLIVWHITAVILFCKVQLMGWQHYYIMIIPFSIITAAFSAIIFYKKKSLGAVVIFILTFNFVQTYTNIFPEEYFGIFSAPYKMPERKDIDDVKKLVGDLNRLTENTDKKIFLIASSDEYNSCILNKVFLPENHEALPSLMETYDVDLRDGFPIHFFDADFIVAVDPIQIHLLPESQSIIVKPAELILNPSPISRHFKKIEEYKFFSGVEKNPEVIIKVYEKISDYEKSDVEFVEKIFDELYPNKPELFKNRFEKYLQEKF
ncbi:MAG: hypothetical protein IK062_10455 [Selenomonadaceae bacterium]|nr:hypothetical protein [Selenomonadaceae bacterium]